MDLNIKCIGIVLTIVEENNIVFNKCKEIIVENKQLKDLLFKKYLKKRTDIAKFQLNQQFILDLTKDDVKLSLTGIVQEMIKRIDDDEAK